MTLKVLCGELLDFVDDPARAGVDAVRYVEQGALVIQDGYIIDRGEQDPILRSYAHADDVIKYDNKLIIPGMIDTHVHYPQTEMIAAYGEQLLTWLTKHTFPTEQQFSDQTYAAQVADVFLKQLLKNGTTTALVFCSVHPESVDAFFDKAQQQRLRMIAGKVMMDRNCPPELQDTAETGYSESKALIEKWHGVDRLLYAITPRFAPTSTPEQLSACRKLMEEFPDVYMQTHVSENVDECKWVAELFPESKDYVGVYEDAGLLRKKSVLAHGIHLSEREMKTLAKHDCAVSHCPTSNLFIGSGLFNLKAMREHDINIGMGTDVGGGSSFSLLQTYNEAYKVQQLKGENLSAYEGMYLNTLGGARALDLEGVIGQLEPGCEADITVLDYAGTDFMNFRLQQTTNFHDKLFALMMLADDRSIYETLAYGQVVHRRDS